MFPRLGFFVLNRRSRLTNLIANLYLYLFKTDCSKVENEYLCRLQSNILQGAA